MKGIIFNQFMDFIEQKMGYEIVDKIILQCHLQSGGAYTSIGTYEPQELLCLVSVLSAETKIPVRDILLEYGEHLFGVFIQKYPQFITKTMSVFSFLTHVHNHVHQEVKKYYKDAQLPNFQCSNPNPNQLLMIYTSTRPLADLAEGLIKGCIAYYQEEIMVERTDIAVNTGAKAKFLLTKRDAV